MAGLLGDSWTDPRTIGLLGLAQDLARNKSLTRGLMGGAQSYSGAMLDGQRMEEERKRRGLQEQMLQMQMQQAQAAMAEQTAQRATRTNDEAIIRKNLTPMPGPMPDGAAGVPPRFDAGSLFGQGLSMGGLGDALKINQAMQPAPRKLTAYKPGDQVRDDAGNVAFEVPAAPEKPKEINPNQPFMLVDGKIVPNEAYQQYDLRARAAGAARSNITVGTGKVGELETSYRKEFNTLPEVVRYKSALPAYKAVEGAAARPGTQSEINLIYGLAKLYDPESVVREGEYDTIAKSQSIPEWIKGQAQRLAGGGKLTPETKAQILVEAKARKAVLENEYNGAQRTYDGIVKRQGLDPQNIFTPIGGDARPSETKAPSRMVQVDGGGSVMATLGADGKYYVKQGGKTYRVEE